MSTNPRTNLTPMAPPPVPVSQTAILEPEAVGLSRSLMQAAVRTGQIYGFYFDSRNLGLQTNAINPPQSLENGLGREVERYEQLCDSIQFTLKRSIAVLRRDLRRREQELKQKELAASSTTVPQPLHPENIQENGLDNSIAMTLPESSPIATSSSLLGRRPSAISMTSLNRPAFPMKLDLSSTALHPTNEAAGMFSTGLASPVTLAPKSARPLDANEIPEDFMAAFSNPTHDVPVGIDLTLPETESISAHNPGPVPLKALGNSADQPIELDMEMDVSNMDLFGDAEGGMEGIFTPVEGSSARDKTAPNGDSDKVKAELDINLLAGLSTSSAAENNNIFDALPGDKQAGATYVEDHDAQFDFSNMDFDFDVGGSELFPALYGVTQGDSNNIGQR